MGHLPLALHQGVAGGEDVPVAVPAATDQEVGGEDDRHGSVESRAHWVRGQGAGGGLEGGQGQKALAGAREELGGGGEGRQQEEGGQDCQQHPAGIR